MHQFHRQAPTRLLILCLFITGLFFSAPLHAAQMADYDGPLFPSDNAWRTPVNTLPVHPRSNAYIASIGAATNLHPDFGTTYLGQPIGIPYNIVNSGQPPVSVTFDYAAESDAGPYPFPVNPLVEGLNVWSESNTGDRHVLIVDRSTNRLYETWNTWPDPDNTAWHAGSGAVFDLDADTLRPDTWTSADAAGLPIFPGLIRYDEVAQGAIHHAIRFTASRTQRAYVWPARHYASSITDPNVPPMGQRFRLKADVDISGFTPRLQVILQAMKTYGLILADNGSNWFFSGTHDDRWDDNELNALKTLQGGDFEAVDISAWLNHPDFDGNSGAVPGNGAADNPTPGQAGGSIEKSTAFPQPAVGRDPVLRFFVGPTNTLKISIYNIAGERVHARYLAVTATGMVGNQPYYDYVWSGEKAPGVYIAVASGFDGTRTITRKIKFAVGK